MIMLSDLARAILVMCPVPATDYGVDVRSSFMPPAEPVARLFEEFSIWEDLLGAALQHINLLQILQTGMKHAMSIFGGSKFAGEGFFSH